MPCRMTKGLIVYTGTPSRFPILPSVLACSLLTAAAITTSPANSEEGEEGQLAFLTAKPGTIARPGSRWPQQLVCDFAARKRGRKVQTLQRMLISTEGRMRKLRGVMIVPLEPLETKAISSTPMWEGLGC